MTQTIPTALYTTFVGRKFAYLQTEVYFSKTLDLDRFRVGKTVASAVNFSSTDDRSWFVTVSVHLCVIIIIIIIITTTMFMVLSS